MYLMSRFQINWPTGLRLDLTQRRLQQICRPTLDGSTGNQYGGRKSTRIIYIEVTRDVWQDEAKFLKKSRQWRLFKIIKLSLVDMNIITVHGNRSKWQGMSSTEPEVVINQYTTECRKTIPTTGRRCLGSRWQNVKRNIDRHDTECTQVLLNWTWRRPNRKY